MTAVSVEIYEVEGTIDLDSIKSNAEGYTATYPNTNLNNDLRTRTEDIEKWSGPKALSFSLVYERPVKVSSWNGQDTWARQKENQRVILTNEIKNGGFLLIGSTEGRDTGISRLLDLMNISEDDYDNIELPTSVVEAIVNQDEQSASTVSAKDIDSHTDSASAAGTLGKSGIANRVESGDITWKQISSKEFGGQTIGIGTDSLVTYGDVWTHKDRLEYVTEIVLDKL